MRVVALLCWYDERPQLLEGMVRSVAPLCSAVVALDGAYELLPGGAARSPPCQADAISRAADRAGLEALVARPRRRWATEARKRTALFRLGETAGADWFLVIDADELLEQCPADAAARLAATEDDSVWVLVDGMPQPRLLRARAGMSVDGAHDRYAAADGRLLWGRPFTDDVEGGTDMSDLVIHHRRDERPSVRLRQQDSYYGLVCER